MLQDTFKKFDEINTTACRWLMYNNKKDNKQLGVNKINFKDKSHLWFIRMLCNYTTFSENLIFTKNFIIYIYIKYILHVKAVRFKLYHCNDIIFIDPSQFIKEIELCFSDKDVTKRIYNNYYRREQK